MLKRLTATVMGRVQGVGFRWHVQRIACSSQLTGYVRNTPDGSVEVVVEGEETALQRLLESLRQGPPGARVEDIRVEWSVASDEMDEFNITH